MKNKQFIACTLMGVIGMTALPIYAEGVDGDGSSTLVRPHYGAEHQHTEVQVNAEPCFDTQFRASVTGDMSLGSPASMGEIACGNTGPIAQLQTITTSEPFYLKFVQSRDAYPTPKAPTSNTRMASARLLRRAGSGKPAPQGRN